jgi:hypothetical protein
MYRHQHATSNKHATSKHVACSRNTVFVAGVVATVYVGVAAFTPPPPAFVRADGGAVVAVNTVRWAVEKDKCWYLCTKDSGCVHEPSDLFDDKLRVCGAAEYEALSDVFSSRH